MEWDCGFAARIIAIHRYTPQLEPESLSSMIQGQWRNDHTAELQSNRFRSSWQVSDTG